MCLISDSNKVAIMNSGALKPLTELLYSSYTEVQCNACGCITSLATTGWYHAKQIIGKLKTF